MSLEKKLILTEEDFKNARILLEEERILPINRKKMFSAGIYCILLTAERFEKSKVIYNKLIENKFTTPEAIIKNREGLMKIIKRARFPNRKLNNILKFASWFLKSTLPEEIMEDISNGRQREFELRNQLAKEAPGIGYKVASYFMIKLGYENVVPVDIWLIRFLKYKGYNVKVPDYKRQGGIKPPEYFEYEKLISEMARKHDVFPALFQFALWNKLRRYYLPSYLPRL